MRARTFVRAAAAGASILMHGYDGVPGRLGTARILKGLGVPIELEPKRIGDEIVHMHAGDTIHVPTGVHHQGVNPGDTVARMVVAYPTGHREMVVVD